MTKLKKDLDWWYYPSVPETQLHLLNKLKLCIYGKNRANI